MHPSLTNRGSAFWLAVIAVLATLVGSAVGQGTGGRILGRVADSSGAVLANVKVTLTNDATGVSRVATTNDSGDYSFVEIPAASYSVDFDMAGFKKNVRHDVVLQVNAVVTLNMTMQVGEVQEVVDVTSEAPLVESSSTQLGAVVDDRSVSQLPLNARDTYQFLQLQPGVMSTVGSSSTVTYGSDKSGAVSVNGGRGRSNNFSVNGGDANDQFVNLPTVQPSPDSIQEFRILTNTFDAEYGRNSGSVVNVVTKSGTNQFHGNVYEFFRNTVLNSRNYFDTTTPKFNQNQFGGTFGGPILKDRTFFFASYEGRRVRQGITSLFVSLPTAPEMPSATQAFANFTDAGGFNPGDVLTNSSVLTNRAGCQAAVTARGGASITDGVAYTSIFPNGTIPLACMDATAVDLLQYLPSSNVTIPVQPSREDQGTLRVDHRINDRQNLSAYYYVTDGHTLQPFANFQLEGSTVPGFGSTINERFQQWNISHTWTLTNNTVNEFRFNYNREAQRTFQHPQFTSAVQSSCPTAPSWLTSVTGPVPCFSDGTAANNLGIHPGLPSDRTGLPFINISGGFFLGNNAEGELPQVGNSFQWSDNLTKVTGNHTLKFGADVRRQRFDQTLYFNVSGDYFYFGGGPNDAEANNGSLYPNYLLGLPDQYGQGSAQTENVRSTSLYLFAQDSWKVKPNITLNYGLRWEFNSPIADIGHRVQAYRPGQVSTQFPCMNSALTDCASQTPVGLVVPGDKGISPGLTQTYYKAIAPRVGIAYSPGSSGKTSIRAGWGMFYNPIEQLVLEQFSAEPPFGGSILLSNTLFNTPFAPQDPTSAPFPNVFNGIITPKPGTPINWALYEPILLYGEFQPHMRAQYSAQYNLTVQRELTHDMKLQVGYVGSQGHRLLATHDINYGNAQTCIDLNNISIKANDPSLACGQFFADSSFNIAAGEIPAGMSLHLPYGPQATVTGPNATPITLVGLRRYSSPLCNPLTGAGCPASGVPVFSSIFAQDTIANSAYNSLQASLEKRFAHGLQFTAAYTFSKSIDQASSFEGILNPIDARNSRALSIFDATHRFVFSYYWELPIQKFDGAKGKILNGWALSGITTFQTGFPIRITSSADNELMNSFDFELPGEPDQIGPFQTLHPQKNGNYYFNPASFTEDTTVDPSLFGRIGNAPRTICCGPHISNTDFAVLKNIPVTEGTHFEFRGELFNLFNHTQFFNPDGNSSDGTQFGQVTQSRDPREVQFALKFYF